MCGIILAGVGVLIDVTLTQASAVWSAADSEPSARRLFAKAMRTGREHAAANVSTIAFVTLGAALPVLLLLVVYPRPLLEMLQTEQFADELVRILVASTGVVLAIPLTTAIAVALVGSSRGGAETAEDQTRPRRRPRLPSRRRGDPPRAPVASRQGRVRGHRRLLRPARAGRGDPPTAPALLIRRAADESGPVRRRRSPAGRGRRPRTRLPRRRRGGCGTRHRSVPVRLARVARPRGGAAPPCPRTRVVR